MESNLTLFFLAIDGFLLYLKLRPESMITKAALTWIGPLPEIGQSWAKFQMRWALYSFVWLCQFALVISALWWFVSKYPEVYSQWLFQLFWFALPIGIGVSLLATVGFLFKATKARYFGPNPYWNGGPNEDIQA